MAASLAEALHGRSTCPTEAMKVAFEQLHVWRGGRAARQLHPLVPAGRGQQHRRFKNRLSPSHVPKANGREAAKRIAQDRASPIDVVAPLAVALILRRKEDIDVRGQDSRWAVHNMNVHGGYIVSSRGMATRVRMERGALT